MIFNLMKPVPVQDEPTMYLYGHEAEADETPTAYIGDVGYVGAVLPKLPEWDKETYPYAVILPSVYPNRYMLYIENVKATADGSTLTWTGLIRTSYVCATGDTEWTLEMEDKEWGDYFGSYSSIVWRNYEMLNKDGSAYLAATEPIPLGEPIAYSYNGTVLPDLPVWDKEKYPYCAIGMWGTLYCCSTTDETYSLKAPFLKFKFIDVGETFVHPDKSHWGECEIIETDDEIPIPIWSNYDIFNPNGTLQLSASEPVPVYLPITLCDGERTFSIGSWEDPSDYRSASVSIGIKCGINVGDTLEITLDGHTETYTARKVDTCNGIIVGNNGLNGNDVEGVDDGGDILLAFPRFDATAWTATLYTRILGKHSVKVRLLEVK